MSNHPKGKDWKWRDNKQGTIKERKKRQMAFLLRSGYTRTEARKRIDREWQPRRVTCEKGATELVGALIGQGLNQLNKGDPEKREDKIKARVFMDFLDGAMSHTWHDIVDLDPSYTIKKAKELYSKYA